MVNALPTPQSIVTDEWVPTDWKEFCALYERSDLKDARFYYDAGQMRIETMPIGSAHGQDNLALSTVLSFYGTLKNIDFVASFAGTNFRKAGERGVPA